MTGGSMPHSDWAGCLFTANGSKRPLDQIVGTRFMKSRQESNRIGRWSGKLSAAAHLGRYVLVRAGGIAKPGEEIRIRSGQQIDRVTLESARLDLEHGHHGRAHAGLPQRRQRDQRAQQRIAPENLKSAETDRNCVKRLEAPEQYARVV